MATVLLNDEGWSHWLKRSLWTVDEAGLLLHGCDPRGGYFTNDRHVPYGPQPLVYPAGKTAAYPGHTRDLLDGAVTTGQVATTVGHDGQRYVGLDALVLWATRLGLPVPQALAHAAPLPDPRGLADADGFTVDVWKKVDDGWARGALAEDREMDFAQVYVRDGLFTWFVNVTDDEVDGLANSLSAAKKAADRHLHSALTSLSGLAHEAVTTTETATMIRAESDTKVFISYSHDSKAHKQAVRQLADRLRADGLVCEIDQFVHGGPAEGWPRWMHRQVEDADFVLVVCTEIYKRRLEGREKPGSGRGVD